MTQRQGTREHLDPGLGGGCGRRSSAPQKRRIGRMRHPASFHPHGVLAVQVGTHAVRVSAYAVQVGARRDGLPLYHAMSAIRMYPTLCVAAARGRGGEGRRHQRHTCFRQMCAALRDR